MTKEKLEEKVNKQQAQTQEYYNLWQQSIGATLMLQHLLKELDIKEGETTDGNE